MIGGARILRMAIGAVLATMAIALVAGTSTEASHPASDSHTYTLDADFDAGTLINVVHTPSDQLQIDNTTTPFGFIWIAASSRGTIVKVDTVTGAILGEYQSSPNGMQRNPSRTTVDANGNVWASNRDEGGFVAANAIAPGLPSAAGPMGSILRIGLQENGQCVDRNTNGVIDTSSGLGDIRSWTNAGNADTLGGVSTADDECIINFVRVNSTGTRHVSVDVNNDLWVSGIGDRDFDLIDGATGAIIRQEPAVGYGGYGGLIDGNNVIWSARPMLRWPVANPLTGPNGDPPGNDIGPLAAGFNWAGQGRDSYGLCIDPSGNVWVTLLTAGLIDKFSPAGVLLGSFAHGNAFAQGCAADGNGDIWVAHSLLGPQNTVGHLLNNGTFVGNVTVGSGPTGVSVDAAGKIWSANLNASTASRIDPTAGPIGGGGAPVGAVDLTVNLGAGAGPYNYSDMTGSTVIAAPTSGTWTIVHDSGTDGAEWGLVSWNAAMPSDSSINVQAASSTDATCTAFNAPQPVANNVDLTVADGQCLKVDVSFTRASTGESPILFDLTIEAFLNDPPTAIAGGPYDVDEGSSVTLDASGSTDPDGDPLTYAWDLDNNGSYETAGVTAAFLGVDGPSVHTVGLEVCDDSNACDTTTVDVTVHNVAPTADAGADQTVLRNELVSLGGSWTDPAGAADDLYSWAWDVDGDAVDDSSGLASYGDTVPESTSFATEGFYTLTFTVTDKDGGSDSDTVVIEVVNQPPSCDAAAPSVGLIWPPNHQFVPITIEGLTDADGDAVTVTIDSIFQDEPLDTLGDGSTEIDGQGVGTDTAEVRAERSGTKQVPGNGRVYHIGFTATDGHGGACSGVVTVGVPHDQGKQSTPVDDGPLYDSTGP